MTNQFYSFCPKCGSPYTTPPNNDHGGLGQHCDQCKHTYYHPLRLTATAVIIDKKAQKILLVKRAWHPGQGTWDLPGGFVDPHENPEEALRRELQEEIGIQVGHLTLWQINAPGEYLYDEIMEYTADCEYLIDMSEDVTLNASDDVAEAKWFLKSEVERLNLFKPVANAIKKACQDKSLWE